MPNRRRVTTLLTAAALGASLAAVPLAAAPAAAATATLASGLTIPWAIAPLPDGSALVTERDSRRIYRVTPGGQRSTVYTVTEARPEGEGGLLGIVAAPDFARTNQFFVYYTTATDNRVARVVLGSGQRPQPIITGIPKGSIHNGGGLTFSPAGFLFVGTGDSGDRPLAQNTRSLGGKVLKVDRNGAAAPGNVWGRVSSIGHRNVQGLTFNRDRLWGSELGQDAQDEVNQLVVGGNYGWPTVEGNSSDQRFRNPAFTRPPAEFSPSGITQIGSTLYVGALRGQRIWKLTTSGASVTRAESLLTGTYGRVRAVTQRGMQDLWFTTSNGNGGDRLIAMRPAP